MAEVKHVKKINLGKSFLVVSSLTLLSRVLGLIRDVVIAAVFPVGMATDAFFTAFKIPNTLRRLTAEGAFSQAFVPVFNAQRNTVGEAAAADLRDAIGNWLRIILLIITILGVIGAPLLISVIAPGFSEIEGKHEIATELLKITFPYIFFISLAAFGGAILNSYGKFAAFAFIPSLLNISLIIAAIFFAPYFKEPVTALAWGVVIGGVVQLLFQAVCLVKNKLFPRFRKLQITPGVKKVAKLTAQGALGVSIAQLGIIISLIFASFLEQGSVTWLYFADRMMELPVGLIGAALGIIALPTLSKHASLKDSTAYSATFDWSLHLALFLALPAAIGLAWLAVPIATTLFHHGTYTNIDSIQTAKAITAYSIGIPALVCVKVLIAGFFARQNPMTPVKVSSISLLITIALNFILVPHLQHVGLALALSIGATINALILVTLLIRREIYYPHKYWIKFLLQVTAALMVMIVFLWWARGDTIAWLNMSSLAKIFKLIFCVLGGCLIYIVILYLTGWRIKNLKSP